MSRSLSAWWELAVAGGAVNVTRIIDTVRSLGLIIVFVTVCLAKPRPSLGGGVGTAIVVTLGLCVVVWGVWMIGEHWPPLLVAGLIGMGATGGVLAGLSPNSPAVAIGCMACLSAAARLRTEASLGITAETMAAFLVTGLVTGASTGVLVGYSFAFVGLWTTGLTRLKFLLRAEQAERMLAETRRARQAETRAAALAERTRIARDIHDVLAHSLAAVSVNLQAAEGLLAAESLPAGNPELTKAIECIGRASTLTREGLAAARRAVLALRDDTAPLPDQLAALAQQYRADGDEAVEFLVTGAARPLPAQASLAAFRTAQEALTNARKHAPGQPVTLGLGFEPGQVIVSATNPLPKAGGTRPLADTGAGAGLAGLTERAALVGGTLEAGPAAGSWRVCLRIPA
ncbi:MAG: histidine kinase [Streptosporangiaceae bacterium]